MRKRLAAPERNPCSIVDCVDQDHHVRIRERNRSGCPRLLQRIEERIIEIPPRIGRAQVVLESTAMQPDVKRPSVQARQPFQDDRSGPFFEFFR